MSIQLVSRWPELTLILENDTISGSFVISLEKAVRTLNIVGLSVRLPHACVMKLRHTRLPLLGFSVAWRGAHLQA